MRRKFQYRIIGLIALLVVVTLLFKIYPDAIFRPSTDLIEKSKTAIATEAVVYDEYPNPFETVSFPQTSPAPVKVQTLYRENEIQLRHGDSRTVMESANCEDNSKELLQSCSQRKFSLLTSYRKASVIICFHDSESLSYLLHTIHSVVQRTPPEILKEIIVIDDFSQKEDFDDTLEIYLRTVFRGKVSLHRNTANLGLIRSRLKGARLAKGPILVFMDSHAEVLEHWLEPLLHEIKRNRKTLASSIIDWLEKKEDGKWTYKYGCTDWTVVFDWSMGFGWNRQPQDERPEYPTEPSNSKAIIGTFYAIEKKFFTAIGEFDEGMEFWGGENIDLSIRTWLYGGRVVLVPCSRAAHFEGRNSRSYRNGHKKIIEKNYKRLAEVWFGGYKDCFYYYFPHLASVDAGDLSAPRKIKSKAPRTFSWYLKNIFPSLGCPTQDGLALGPTQNMKTKRCLTMVFDKTLTTIECGNDARHMKMYWSDKFHLREPNYIVSVKNDVIYRTEYLTEFKNDSGPNFKWLHFKNGPIMHVESKLCLEDQEDNSGKVKLVECNYRKNPAQLWEFDRYTHQYELMINRRSKSFDKDMHNTLLEIYHQRRMPLH